MALDTLQLLAQQQQIGQPGYKGQPTNKQPQNRLDKFLSTPGGSFLMNILAQSGYSPMPSSPFGAIGKAALMTQQQERQQGRDDLQERFLRSRIGLQDAQAAALGIPKAQERFEFLTDEDIKTLGLDPSRDYQRSTVTGKILPIGSPGQTINVSNEGQIPAGYRAIRDPQGRIERYEIIEDSPQEAEIEAGARLRSIQAQTVVEDIQRLNSQIDAGTVPFGRSALAQSQLNPVLQSDGYRNAVALIESVKGNVGVDSLINIKKSGAGLGQVPQTQLDLLSRLLGELSLGQEKDQFEHTWNRIGKVYKEIWAVADDDLKAIGAMPPDVFDMQIGGMSAQDRIDKLEF